MLKFEDLAIGKKYRNKKNQSIYTIINIGIHTEREEVEVNYVDSNGLSWFRPIGLFMLKFENTIDLQHDDETVNYLCGNHGWSQKEAEQIVVKYSEVIKELDVDISYEELAENLDFAQKNNLTAREWITQIERTK